MRTNSLLLGLWPVAAFSAAISPATKGFPPDQRSFTWNGGVYQLPVPYNLSDSQHRGEIQIDGSCWANSFIHGSNGHDYYIASHVMDYAAEYGANTPPVYRSTILDITDPSYYLKWVRNAPANTSLWGEDGGFYAVFDGWGMEATSSDPFQGIRAYSSVGGIEYDLTFNFTSPVLLNAALGSYWVGGELGYEWSIPKAATQGWLKIDGEIIDIVPEKSSTWYDRQWASVQDSFQWMMINFEESDWLDISTMCAWDWKDVVNGGKEFATIRSSKTGRDSVVPLSVKESSANVYVSPETGLVYPLEWVITLDDLEVLVTSPRADQVLEAPPETGLPWQFSGYLDVVATKAGHAPVKGYAAIDLLQPFP